MIITLIQLLWTGMVAPIGGPGRIRDIANKADPIGAQRPPFNKLSCLSFVDRSDNLNIQSKLAWITEGLQGRCQRGVPEET
jgi:hypothetical protein